VRHPEHGQFSVAEMLEHERAAPDADAGTPFDGYVEKPARVSSTCLVSVARNRYSVPCELGGQMVSTRLYPGSVVVVADDKDGGHARAAEQSARPLRLAALRAADAERKPGALRNGAPFADMPEPLQRCAGAAAQEGGDRVMAQVLARCPPPGWTRCWWRWSWRWRPGRPGRVSTEHVVNVLGRLNAQPAARDGCDAAAGEPRRRWPTRRATTACALASDMQEADHA
jgi:hypothetical protein